MKNYEYFKQKIDELDGNGIRIAIVQGEPVRCGVRGLCKDCYRFVENGNKIISCSELKLIKWAVSEHEEKLKPCPFCGGRARIGTDGEEGHTVFCTSCKVETNIYEDERTAIEAWNRRANV